MIFINKHSLGVVIPIHQSTVQDIFRLELVHQTTQQKFVFDNLENTSEQRRLYLFQSDFSQLIDGTYNYFLYDENAIVEEGLLVFGDWEMNNTEYEKDNKTVAYNG